ncbi:MAG: hypothetical protein KDE09_04155 [Anaerolineales bacterium]|nr:hypothetical protein [Anaerolineales bacterium]MCB0016958.1 hypothetical protein [Anaerolineales bacterium]
MMNNPTVIAHLAYLVLSIGLTVWVARTLFEQGAIFLQDAFGGDKYMTKGLGQLLQMGFYLLAFGFISFFLRAGGEPNSLLAIVEQVSTKVGVILLMLAFLHFGNIFNFAKIRRKAHRPVAQASEA